MQITELSLKELHDELAIGNIKLSDVVAAYKNNFIKSEDKIKAFITSDWEAVEQQAKNITLDQIKADKSFILGVPMGIKDLFMTHGTQTTAGSKILENYQATYTATAIQKLLNAGGLIVGKNNCDEFAMGGSTENSGFFPTHNPYDLTKVPGGSSGGSAASVAAREVAFSIGSDTGGSIRQPAGFCGVVGLKPTYGLVSRYGLIAMASSLDSVGPITKSVSDAAYVLQAIAGPDKLDSTTNPTQPNDYITALAKNVKGLKVGIPKQADISTLGTAEQEQIQQVINWLKDAGVEVVDIDLEHLKQSLAVYYIIMPAEVSSNMARYDGIRFGQAATATKDLLDFYMKTRGEYIGTEVKRRIMIGTYVLSSGYVEAYYKNAQKVRRLIANECNKVFASVDAILLPTSPTTAFGIGEKINNPLEMYLSDIYTVTANIAGLPAISVPSGFINNLPFGVQFYGKHFAEDTIIALARTVEQSREELAVPNL